MTESELQELRDQIRKGDDKGLRLVFEQTHRYCTRTLVKKTGVNTEDAEDLYMDALLIFRENLLSEKLQQLSNLQTYLFGICYNLWRDLNRAREKWAKESNEVERQLLLILGQEAAPFEQTEAELMREQINHVTLALNKLGETCRKLLTYVYVEQLPHREIAQLLGMSGPEVVKVTRHRCYQQWIRHIEQLVKPSHGQQ